MKIAIVATLILAGLFINDAEQAKCSRCYRGWAVFKDQQCRACRKSERRRRGL